MESVESISNGISHYYYNSFPQVNKEKFKLKNFLEIGDVVKENVGRKITDEQLNIKDNLTANNYEKLDGQLAMINLMNSFSGIMLQCNNPNYEASVGNEFIIDLTNNSTDSNVVRNELFTAFLNQRTLTTSNPFFTITEIRKNRNVGGRVSIVCASEGRYSIEFFIFVHFGLDSRIASHICTAQSVCTNNAVTENPDHFRVRFWKSTTTSTTTVRTNSIGTISTNAIMAVNNVNITNMFLDDPACQNSGTSIVFIANTPNAKIPSIIAIIPINQTTTTTSTVSQLSPAFTQIILLTTNNSSTTNSSIGTTTSLGSSQPFLIVPHTAMTPITTFGIPINVASSNYITSSNLPSNSFFVTPNLIATPTVFSTALPSSRSANFGWDFQTTILGVSNRTFENNVTPTIRCQNKQFKARVGNIIEYQIVPYKPTDEGKGALNAIAIINYKDSSKVKIDVKEIYLTERSYVPLNTVLQVYNCLREGVETKFYFIVAIDETNNVATETCSASFVCHRNIPPVARCKNDEDALVKKASVGEAIYINLQSLDNELFVVTDEDSNPQSIGFTLQLDEDKQVVSFLRGVCTQSTIATEHIIITPYDAENEGIPVTCTVSIVCQNS